MGARYLLNVVPSDGVVNGFEVALIGEVRVRILMVGQQLHQGGPTFACSQHQWGAVCGVGRVLNEVYRLFSIAMILHSCTHTCRRSL